MSLARCRSVALVGMHAHVVDVEVDVGIGLPQFILTALSDRVLNQVEHRVRSAVANSGEAWPTRKMTVSLSPATVPKSGSRFDLAIGATVLAAAGALPAARLAELVLLGELTLGGAVRSVAGVLPAVIGACRAGARRIVVPRANLGEARLIPDADVVGVASFAELCGWLRGHAVPDDVRAADPTTTCDDDPPAPDFADVIGQLGARHALEVAAAGGHHVLMVGPPGVGKSLLAERLPGILPDLGADEALEVTALYSVVGRLRPGDPLMTRPPFCAPHHTASVASIVGGGSGIAAPGAISLANRGVLFLDEAPEFDRRVLDALRQPLESGTVTLTRTGGGVTYPARFQLVLAANPCPCSAGGRDRSRQDCVCSAALRRSYQSRLSGPFRDRIDLTVRLDPVSRAVLAEGARGEPSAEIRARVHEARTRAARRLRSTAWRTNAEVPGPLLRRHWPLPRTAVAPLHAQLERGLLSTRGLDRVLKVAWTLADLAGRDQPGPEEVRGALQLRLAR
jgi:magnesium chelatase family protein